jgi:hypothetical protein
MINALDFTALGKRKSYNRYAKIYILNIFTIYNDSDILLFTDYKFITYVL